MVKRVPTVLTIGGSDSSGGAGVQADLKVFSSLGIHGCSVITCVTAQNTRRIDSVFPVPTREVEIQIKAILSDIQPRVVKTGVLYSGAIAGAVARQLKELEWPVVVDPVMTATVGRRLCTKNYLGALKKNIVPLANVITPNVEEASMLSGIAIKSLEDAKRSARTINEMGADNVIIKSVPFSKDRRRRGGEQDADHGDLHFDGRVFREFRGSRYDRVVHGSGCVFASAITAYLAKGLTLRKAIERSRVVVLRGINYGYGIGKGLEVVNSHYIIDRYSILKELEDCIVDLKKILTASMMPEVGVNFGYAVPLASSLEDVCAIKGRLTKEGKRFRRGNVDFGASKHIGTIILTAMRFDPEMRSALNLKYDASIVSRAGRRDLILGTFERTGEPKGRSTMEWGVESAIRKCGRVPDVIYDLGGVGKEPMIRVLGRNPEDVLRKARMLSGVIK